MDGDTLDGSESATPGETGLSPKWGVLVGVLVAYSEMIVRLLSGKTLVDSVWPHAVRSLEWTLGLRASPTLTLSLF